jgi:ketosteroid isomerase-like protein
MNREIIDKFYTSFQNKDWKAMQSCYQEDAVFSDPVFQQLTTKQVKAMWHMLLQSDAAIELTYKVLLATEETGSCHWEAKYKFSTTGRDVHNIIETKLEFKGGKILRHADTFDLWRWSGMALGWPGKILGWSPIIQNKIRTTAQKRLFRFIQDHPEYK